MAMILCHDEEYKETGSDIESALPISGLVSSDLVPVEDLKMGINTFSISLIFIFS